MSEIKAFILFFFALFLCILVQDVSPQTYTITEEQLQKLEMESRSWNEKNLMLQKSNLKLSEINENLKEQLEKSESLSTDRQKTIEQLTKSCSKLEINLADERAKNAETLQELNDSKLREQKQKTTIVILSSVLAGIVLLIGISVVLKIKKIF